MNDERDEIFKANEGFYRAFQKFDMGEMEKVWLKDDSIQCFHPGWGMLRGWKPVMESWRRIFENTSEMRFVLTDVRVEIRGPLACVTLYENLTSRVGAEVAAGVVLTTNFFEKRPEGWLMIHHHGSSVIQPPADPSPTTIH